MKRPVRAVIIILLLVVAFSAGNAVVKAVTPTPAPTESAPAETLPFSGGTGTISGKVVDSSGNGIRGAKVTLYNAIWVPYDYKAVDQVKIKDNPQSSSDGSVLPVGAYVFTNVPSGAYILTAEKGGVSISGSVQITGGAITMNPVIPGYIEDNPTPTPLPTKAPTGWPTAAVQPGADIWAAVYDAFRVVLMCAVAVQLSVSVVVIALQVTRKR